MSHNTPARRAALVSIDGGPFVAVPFYLADFATPTDFARDVVAALAWAETGHVVTGIREVGSLTSGAYGGTFNAGRRRVRFAFKSAPSPVGLIAGRHLAAALSSTAMVPQQAQQQQAQARPARPIAQARKLTPGPAHLWPAAEGAVESGCPTPAHDATLIGYNAPGGVYFAAVYLLGPSAGQHAGRYRVEVCHARAPYDARLCGTFAALDFACLHLGRLEVLAAYRAKRRAVLAGLASVRRAFDRLDFGARVLRSAESVGVTTARRDLAELRRYYGPTLAALARVSWVPRAPRPVAMVPQVAQLQQAQHMPARAPNPHPMAPAIEAVSRAGFDVYMRNDQGTTMRGDSWLYFTDGTRIGHLQISHFGGAYSLSTVHVPNARTGTGYSLNDRVLSASELTRENLLRAFDFAPAWGSHRDSVRKWADWAAFAKAEKWADYVRVAGPDRPTWAVPQAVERAQA